MSDVRSKTFPEKHLAFQILGNFSDFKMEMAPKIGKTSDFRRVSDLESEFPKKSDIFQFSGHFSTFVPTLRQVQFFFFSSLWEFSSVNNMLQKVNIFCSLQNTYQK